MVKKNKIVGVCIFLLAIIAFVWIVMAAAGDGVVILAPTSGTNYSSSVYFSVNYTNNTDISEPVNATFYYNVSGGWTKIGNTSSGTGGCNWLQRICNVTLDVSGLTEGIYSINATIDNGTRRVSALKTANLTSLIRFDFTAPTVYKANITLPADYSNHSFVIGNTILLNVTILDTSSADYVFFNITNFTGTNLTTVLLNSTFFPATKTGDSYYNNSLNSSLFPDGLYNITVWANDTAGNLNNTASITVRFDNTKPLVFAKNINSPVNVSNYTGTIPLNVTIYDATAGIGTVIFEIRNKTGATNGTNFTGVRENSTKYSYLLDTSSFLNGVYNVTVWANDSAGNVNNTLYTTGGISGFRFDNTPPIVYSANITSPSSNSVNYSTQLGFVVFNVTLFDTGDNGVGVIDTVIFNVTNSTGNQNATFVGVREGTTNYYSNNTINVTAFPDGRYTVKVWANDTAGATNNTASRTNTGFDVNVPDISFSCTPSSVKQAETVTCTCTASDTISGLNLSYGTSGVSFTAKPSTSQTGTFTTYCYSRDMVENTASKSFTYAVESGTGTGGGGGGGGDTTKWTTYSISNNQFTTGYTKDLKANQRLEVSISNTNHYVGVLSVSSTNAKIEVSSTPQQTYLGVGETKKFEVTGDNFRDISVTLNSISGSKAKVTIKSVHEEIPQEPALAPPSVSEPEVEETVPIESPAEEGETNYPIWVVGGLVILIIGIVIWFVVKKKERY